MFKEKCMELAKDKKIQTMLISEKSESNRYHEKRVFRWDLYLIGYGHGIPLTLKYEADFDPSNFKKTIYYQHEAILPTYQIVKFIEEADLFMKEFLEDEVKKMDKDRIRRVVEGKVEKDGIRHIAYHPYQINGNDSQESLEEERIEKTTDDFAYEILNLKEREKGYRNKNLLVFGNKGKQLGEKLKEKGLAEVITVDPSTDIITPLFPFIYDANELFLSDKLLHSYEVKDILKNSGIQHFIVNEGDVKRYVQ